MSAKKAEVPAKQESEMKALAANDGHRCKWAVGTKEKDPHAHEPFRHPPLVLNTILEHIGNTPVVRVNKIAESEGLQCELLAKCEYFNAGGSVKDRIGKRMIEDAEKSGRIKKGDTLIEPTSGNTGIGLALAAAIKGYRMIITLPEKMSKEKVDILKALGAEIVRTPTEAAFDSPDSHIGVAKRLNQEIKNSHILDQYANPSNPLAHYDGTAEEILEQCEGKLDAVVLTAGTGGTLTGIARKLKEKLPNIQVIGVDPVGSILALPESLNGPIHSYAVEGIGYDFIPKVLDRSLVDQWVKTEDKESFIMARRLIREEGLFVGGSSGSAMAAAVKIAKNFKKGQRVLVLLPDSVRNYMTKFLDPDWMVDRGFMETEEKNLTSTEAWLNTRYVSELKLTPPLTVECTVSCQECVDILNTHGFDQLPVVDMGGQILGMATLGNLTSKLISGRIKRNDPVGSALYGQWRKVSLETSLRKLQRIFEKDAFALVVTEQALYTSRDAMTKKTLIVGIVTQIDLLNFIMKNQPAPPSSSPQPSPTHSKQEASAGAKDKK